jgi:hypothetical protein
MRKKRKKRKEKRPKVNLIFSHVNHNFLVFGPCIEPQNFIHTHEKKSVFFECEEGSNARFNLLQIGPELLVPRPLSKVGLSLCPYPKKQSLNCI